MAWRRCSGPRQKAQLVCRSSTARRLEHDLWRQSLCAGVAAGPLALLVGAGCLLASILTRVKFTQSTQDSRKQQKNKIKIFYFLFFLIII